MKKSLENKIFQICFGVLFISVLFLSFQNNFIGNGSIITNNSELGILFNSNSDSWNLEWIEDTYGVRIAFDSEENIVIGCDDYPGFSLVKYNSSGNKIWSTGYWAIWDFYLIEDIAIDSFDNIYVLGHTAGEMVGWDPQYFIIKFNQSGSFEWKEIGIFGEYCFPYAITCDSYDNLYTVITAISYIGVPFIVINKYSNSSGGWMQTWHGYNYNEYGGVDICTDSFDNIYVLGGTNDTLDGNYDIILLKYNNTGDFLWKRTYGGINNDYAAEIDIDSSSNINILGTTEINGNFNSFLLKYNSSGNFLSNRTFFQKTYNSFAIDSSQNYFFTHTGEYFENMGTDIYIAKYNNSGYFISDLIWGDTLQDSCYDIAIDSIDNIYITGYTKDKMILVKNPKDKTNYSQPGIFTLTVNTTEVGINESFSLSWTDSRGAKNYSIYVHDDYIRDIGNPAVLTKEGLENTSISISGLPKGTYFYLVASYNKNGYTVSNCVYIIINDNLDPPQGIPTEFFYLLFIFLGIGVVYIISTFLISKRIFRSI
ncbi:MAG: SBBP repeat-containing protein [Promethearchaeota archaeon]